MRLSRVLIAGAAVAAAGIATSAFTASNDVPPSVAGYGSAEVAGATVTNIKYNQDTDPSKLASVVFTVQDDAADTLSTLTLYKADDDGVGPNTETTLPDESDCTPSTVGPDFFITCSFGLTPVSLEAFDKVGLTVVSQ
jgi:hypothetical protein